VSITVFVQVLLKLFPFIVCIKELLVLVLISTMLIGMLSFIVWPFW